MHDALNPQMLARYLDGSATSAERAEVEAWLAGDPGRPAAMAELRALWARGDRSERYKTRPAWTKVRRRILRPRRAVPWIAAAASVALMVGAGLWYAGQHMFSATAPAATTVATTAGQLRTLDLVDGTRATLGAGSRLMLDEQFSKTDRRVRVEGSVFFQVAHDPARPFRVSARGAETTVLGTEFSVRAYADDPAVEVVVKSGRVAFGPAAGPSTVLRPDQQARLTDDGRLGVVAVDAERYLSWTTGRLEFNDVPLSDVIHELNRWFGLDLDVEDRELAARRIIKTFGAASRDEIVRSLAELVDADLVPNGGQTVLRPKSSSH